jgi:parvulin-like peptidyl-prolyl isomerase
MTIGSPNTRHTRGSTRIVVLAPFVACGVLWTALVGCSHPAAGPAGPTMADAMAARSAVQSGQGLPQAGIPSTAPVPVSATSATIATVNGRPIAYAAWFSLLKRTGGLRAFQQVLAVELARQAAQAKGIVLTEPQLEAAYRQEVTEVVGPEAKDPAEADRILRAVLTRRGVGLDEFRLSADRNAYLRRVAEPMIAPGVTDDALKVEFDRLYGPKVQVRHIQLSDSSNVGKVLDALNGGTDFPDVARKFSQNLDSAADGGLLPPFSRLDPNVPPEIREVAFGLEPGKASGPFRIDGWTQILRVEKRLPAEPVEYDKVVDDIRRSLTDRLIRQKMQELLLNMLQSASIQIYDEEIARQFQALREGK